MAPTRGMVAVGSSAGSGRGGGGGGGGGAAAGGGVLGRSHDVARGVEGAEGAAAAGDQDPGDAEGIDGPLETASLRRAIRENTTSTPPAMTLQAMDT